MGSASIFSFLKYKIFTVLPRIRPFEFESAVFAGEPVQLTCFVTKGDKPLRISWYLHSKELTSQTGITTSTMGDRASSLSIASTGLSNAGNYTCVAQNAVGMDYYSAYLEVNGIYLDMIFFIQNLCNKLKAFLIVYLPPGTTKIILMQPIKAFGF